MKIALFMLMFACFLWVGSMIVDPYTAWGVEHEQVRPSVARTSVQLAAAALIVVLAATFIAFRRASFPRDWKRVLFAAALTFFGATALARIIWIQFYVLM